MPVLEEFSSHALVAALGLVSAVIVIAALLSGLVERSGIPQVAVFLALGAALGPAGLDLLSVGLESPALRVVATLSLTLILFTDALSLSLREIRAHRALVALVVGPGTLLAAALFAALAWWWLDLAPAAAAILGAALASTDPVLLKGLLRRSDLGRSASLALRLESGLNDVVLLPVVLVAAALLMPRSGGAGADLAALGTDLLLLGPTAGVAVGVGSLATLDLVRRRIGVRRDYESLYSLGVALAAYAAAESVGGSGFLAAFAAGLTIAAFDVDLCDCFREYGETTAELALLLTFVLLGSSLIWTGVASAGVRELGFALLVLLGRPAVYLVALVGTRMERRDRWLVAWFGPRGLSTLLLVLLAVFLGVPGSDVLFRIACLVVLLSVLLHGGALVWMGRRGAGGSGSAREVAPALPPAALPPDGADPAVADRVRIGSDELLRLRASQAPPVVADVRSQLAWAESDVQAAGALRMAPDRPAEVARRLGLPSDRWLVLYCT
jgi:NhaP-type Na+/H+ or K+/H+ antiporter